MFTMLVLTEVAPVRFLGVAVWEGLRALATAAGLWVDRRRNGNQPVTAKDAGG